MMYDLREAFALGGFVDVTAMLPPGWLDDVTQEVTAVLDAHAVRCDVNVAATGGSPRALRDARCMTYTAKSDLRVVMTHETLEAIPPSNGGPA